MWFLKPQCYNCITSQFSSSLSRLHFYLICHVVTLFNGYEYIILMYLELLYSESNFHNVLWAVCYKSFRWKQLLSVLLGYFFSVILPKWFMIRCIPFPDLWNDQTRSKSNANICSSTNIYFVGHLSTESAQYYPVIKWYEWDRVKTL